MSIYDFYPMKKRKICKTSNGGRSGSTSTLGILNKTDQLASAADSGIEVLWDNNSPSPTTTLALAGKRRRKRQNNRSNEESETTDISFVVQKLSENTSPVVDNTRSTLLEMWISKEQEPNECDENFTSPPNETRQTKTTILATPNQKVHRRTSRKNSRQFMLQIQKLLVLDEMQKNDLVGTGSQRNSQKEQDQCHSRKEDIGTHSKALPEQQMPSTSCISMPESNIIVTNDIVEDSFEWTEDDMDELILTCQLSSSGKGSIDVPDHPKPQCGFSPSNEQTQVLFEDNLEETCDNQGQLATVSYNVPEQLNEEKSWEMDFADDDSLLESAAQEFELSQQSVARICSVTPGPTTCTTAARTNQATVCTRQTTSPANPACFTKLYVKNSVNQYINNTRGQVTCVPNNRTGESVVAKKPVESGLVKKTVENAVIKKSGENAVIKKSGDKAEHSSSKKPGESASVGKPDKNQLGNRHGDNRETVGTFGSSQHGVESVGTKKSGVGMSLKKPGESIKHNHKLSLRSQKSNRISHSEKSDENCYSNKVQQNSRAKTNLISPLKGRSGNLMLRNKESTSGLGGSSNKPQSDRKCISGSNNQTNCVRSKGMDIDGNDVKCLLSDNLDALLEDFNLDDICLDEAMDSLTTTNTKTSKTSDCNTIPPTQLTNMNTCKTSNENVIPPTCQTSNKNTSIPPSQSQTKSYTQQEIEQKRMEAQRRRLAKHKVAPKSRKEAPR